MEAIFNSKTLQLVPKCPIFSISKDNFDNNSFYSDYTFLLKLIASFWNS